MKSFSTNNSNKPIVNKGCLYFDNQCIAYDKTEETNQFTPELFHELDNILHNKLHMTNSSFQEDISQKSVESNELNMNKMCEEAVEKNRNYDDDQDQDFTQVDEVDLPISSLSLSKDGNDSVMKSIVSPITRKFGSTIEEGQTFHRTIGDDNLPVDSDYQKILDQRARELCGDGTPTLQTTKPQIDWSMKDFYSLKIELPDWFTLTDYNHLKSSLDQFKSNFNSSRFMEDTSYSINCIKDLGDKLSNNELDLESILCLSYISFGIFDVSVDIDSHLKAIERNNILLIPLLSTIIHAFKIHAMFCRDKISNLVHYTTLLFYSSSILYFIISTCITKRLEIDNSDIIKVIEIIHLENLLVFVTKYIENWRWSSRLSMRIRNMINLFHKLIILQFGDRDIYKSLKNYIHKIHNIQSHKNNPHKLSLSPLDYQAFREDLVSRFPVVFSPTTIIPQELDNPNSLSQFLEIPRPKAKSTFNMTLNEPQVHISTPAPSPPESPFPQINGTRSRRSFQTNMAFPVLYPSDNEDETSTLSEKIKLSESCNNYYLPYSIQEAINILSNSVEVKLSTKQLWFERDLFMIQERGWDNIDLTKQLDDPYNYDKVQNKTKEIQIMCRIEEYYKECLPSLNSLVYILLQIIESNITNYEVFINDIHDSTQKYSFNPQLEITRAKEISLKASIGSLFLLLKWFKLSHILKSEYLSSLIFDSKYISISTSLLSKFSHNYSERIHQQMLSPLHSFWKECSVYNKSYKKSINDNSCILETDLNYRMLNSEVYILQILSKITGRKTQRLKELPLNIGSLFNRIYNIFNLDIYHPLLRIVHELAPFKNKRWKSEHMILISGVYLYKKLSLTDNWVTGKDLNGELNDSYGQEIALRAIIQFYNFHRYKESMDKLGYGDRKSDSFFTRENELLATSL